MKTVSGGAAICELIWPTASESVSDGSLLLPAVIHISFGLRLSIFTALLSVWDEVGRMCSCWTMLVFQDG